jgi:hypothetical protein
MQLSLLFACILVTLSIASSRIFPDKKISIKDEGNSENFVLIGESSKEAMKPKIEDDKNFRTGHYYSLIPMAITHTKPNSDYYSSTPSHHNHHHHPTNGLISANIQLLEPFMLMTFLLFVLCLVDKARLPLPISRIDKDIELYESYANFVNSKRNQTEL